MCKLPPLIDHSSALQHILLLKFAAHCSQNLLSRKDSLARVLDSVLVTGFVYKSPLLKALVHIQFFSLAECKSTLFCVTAHGALTLCANVSPSSKTRKGYCFPVCSDRTSMSHRPLTTINQTNSLSRDPFKGSSPLSMINNCMSLHNDSLRSNPYQRHIQSNKFLVLVSELSCTSTSRAAKFPDRPRTRSRQDRGKPHRG